MQAVKGVARDLDAQLVGDGGQVQQAVGAARNGRVDQDGVLEAFQRHDAAGAHGVIPCHGHGPRARLAGIGQQVGTGGGHQRAARQRQTQRLGHDLHGGGRADEAARAAAGAGVLLGPVQPGLVDLAALEFGAVHAQLLQREHLRPGVHGAARHHHRGDVHPQQTHEVGGHALVAAGKVDARVEGRGPGVDLDHVGDHLAAGQAVIDAVGALALAVTDVGAVIACAVAARGFDAAADFLHQRPKVAAARGTVARGALDEDLGLDEVLRRPARAQTQRVQLGGKGAHFLTDKAAHKRFSFL